jgi:hypothetical protein
MNAPLPTETETITWHRLLDRRPPKSGEYQVKNAAGFITNGYYDKPRGWAVYGDGWSGSITHWAEPRNVH